VFRRKSDEERRERFYEPRAESACPDAFETFSLNADRALDLFRNWQIRGSAVLTIP
jgi:hypothetical protein